MSSELFAAEKVGKRYGASIALADVGITVHTGEIHAVVGENGAGKSTLLGVMSGLIQPDSGDLRFRGEPVESRGIRRGSHVAVVQQELALCGNRTVAENVFLGGEIARSGIVRKSEMKSATRVVLERLGVSLPPSATVDSLSPAERQLTEVARAVHQDAPLLVLDEPTSSLSLEESEKLLSLLVRLRDLGHGVVLVSQRLHEVMSVADQITILRDGHLVAHKRVDETNVDEVARLMVGRQLPVPEERDDRELGKVALEARGLESAILRNVSFRMEEGEVVGIAGLDGAGRTELLETVFGLRPRTSGAVSVGEREIVDVRSALQAGLAYVGPDRKDQFFFERSIQDNVGAVQLGSQRGLRWIRADRLRQAAVRAIQAVNVVPARPRLPVRSLSGGNQQKLLLGRWLTRDVKLWLLSEPTRGVDIGAKAEIYRAIEDLAAEGASFCISSSELPELMLLADRIIVMHNGGVVGELSRSEATEERIMEMIYDLGGIQGGNARHHLGRTNGAAQSGDAFSD